MNTKDLKLEFAPGCFDEFDGTQEELDELIEHIKSLVDSGTLFDHAVPVGSEDVPEELAGIFEDLDIISQNFDKATESRNKKLN